MSIFHDIQTATYFGTGCWLGTLVVLHILRMLIWTWPDPRSRSRGFWTSDN